MPVCRKRAMSWDARQLTPQAECPIPAPAANHVHYCLPQTLVCIATFWLPAKRRPCRLGQPVHTQWVMTTAAETPAPPAEISAKLNGAAMVVSLDRVQALNALTPGMVSALARVFPDCARNPQVYCVVLRSTSPKAFCAGGDVRALVTKARHDMAAARADLAAEYGLNWLHECFSKPTIALMGGVVMGSGAGITAYGTHRVAGARYRFAMPETAIGLFPDVGVAWVLARLAGEMGTYLGLTGRTIGRADAMALGLVTHCIDDAQFDPITTLLADAQPVDPMLDERHVDPGPSDLKTHAETIARCFSAQTVEEIIERLAAVSGPEQAWAEAVVADLKTRSPLSLKVTLRHLRESRALDLRQTLQVDYRLACRFLEGHDFHEGVRAVLVDKDGKPVWQPARLGDVTTSMVDDHFADMGPAELALPTRAEMQAARV